MEFESFFPEPPELKKGQKWHIFVSYRSPDRPWVLKLYDALKHLEYEVFVDQFVLSAGAPLAGSLGDGVDKSGAAVIVWSKNYATSKWIEDEYNAIKSRQNSDPIFTLGIAKKDATPIHGLLAGQIPTDFSDLPDGPCGEALLRLLLGMSGRPLPPGAVQLATQIDAARVEASLENNSPVDYYEQATLAEARLLQGDYQQACKYYNAAVLMAPGETGSHKGPLEQAREIMRFLEAPPPEREAVEQVFAHLKLAATG